MKKYLEVGKIVNTHGIRGELKLQLWCDDAEYLKRFKTLYFDENGNKSIRLLSVRPHKNAVIIKLEGVDNMDSAEQLKNSILFADRDDAPQEEGAHYIQDIIGWGAGVVGNGGSYGRGGGVVSDVLNYGASDILEIKSGKKTNLVPLVDDIVCEIDEIGGVIKIKPIKGLFDEN